MTVMKTKMPTPSTGLTILLTMTLVLTSQVKKTVRMMRAKMTTEKTILLKVPKVPKIQERIPLLKLSGKSLNRATSRLWKKMELIWKTEFQMHNVKSIWRHGKGHASFEGVLGTKRAQGSQSEPELLSQDLTGADDHGKTAAPLARRHESQPQERKDHGEE